MRSQCITASGDEAVSCAPLVHPKPWQPEDLDMRSVEHDIRQAGFKPQQEDMLAKIILAAEGMLRSTAVKRFESFRSSWQTMSLFGAISIELEQTSLEAAAAISLMKWRKKVLATALTAMRAKQDSFERHKSMHVSLTKSCRSLEN